MVNMETLKRQHEDILNVIIGIQGEIVGEIHEQEAANIASQISILAGKLKVHLNTEDQFLYPSLSDNISLELRELGKRYFDEMGSIGEEFTEYKDKYNTRTKILNDVIGFVESTKKMMKLLEQRIEKENKMLYPLI